MEFKATPYSFHAFQTFSASLTPRGNEEMNTSYLLEDPGSMFIQFPWTRMLIFPVLVNF